MLNENTRKRLAASKKYTDLGISRVLPSIESKLKQILYVQTKYFIALGHSIAQISNF